MRHSPTEKSMDPDNPLASWLDNEPPELLPAEPLSNMMEVDGPRSEEMYNLGTDFTQLGLYTQGPDTCIEYNKAAASIQVVRPKPPVKIEVIRPLACPVDKLKESQSQLSKGPSKLNISAKSSFSRPEPRPAASDFSQLADYSLNPSQYPGHSAAYPNNMTGSSAVNSYHPANYMYNPHGYRTVPPSYPTVPQSYPTDVPAGASHSYPTVPQSYPTDVPAGASHSYPTVPQSYPTDVPAGHGYATDHNNELENNSVDLPSSQFSQMSSSQASQDISFTQFQDMLNVQENTSEIYSSQMSHMSSTQNSSSPVTITEMKNYIAKSGSNYIIPDNNQGKLTRIEKRSRDARSKRFKDKLIVSL